MNQNYLIELILKMLKDKVSDEETGLLMILLLKKSKKELEDIYNKTFEYEIEKLCYEICRTEEKEVTYVQ